MVTKKRNFLASNSPKKRDFIASNSPTSSAIRPPFDSSSSSYVKKKTSKRKGIEKSNAFDSCVGENKKVCRYCKLRATPVEVNKAPNVSKSDDIEREKERERDRERLRKRKELEEDLLREPPFKTICLKAAEFKAYSLHPNSDRNEVKVQKDVRISVEEETLKLNQARCGSILARNISMRLLEDNKTVSKGVLKPMINFKPEKDCGEDKIWLKIGGRMLGFVSTEEKTVPQWPWTKSRSKDGCSQKMPVIVKLGGVTIFPEVDGQGGDTIVGTLEAHNDKFIYTTSTSYFDSHLSFDYDNVKEVFFQVENDEETSSENMLSLLHFRLHQHMKVGTKKREHIQFRLVLTAIGEKLDYDLEKFEKRKQTRVSSRNKDLNNFIDKVGEKWRGSCPPFSFRRVSKQGQFEGVLPSNKLSDIFYFTFSSLLQLQNSSFVVVNMQEIEIVHLAKLRPEEVDITVVFKDLKRPVLQISSIPLDSLQVIKRTLDRWGVKFYENSFYLEWSSIMRNVAEDIETFVKKGGWGAYGLHDSASSIYHMHYHLELSQAAIQKKDMIWG